MAKSNLTCLVLIVLSFTAGFFLAPRTIKDDVTSHLTIESAAHYANRLAFYGGFEVSKVAPLNNHNSMAPTISGHSLVLIDPNAYGSIEVNQIVVFKNSDGIRTLHRVIGKRGAFWQTKGDNNLTPDQPFTEEQYLGTLVAEIPYNP
jgi:signal peptidase I